VQETLILTEEEATAFSSFIVDNIDDIEIVSFDLETDSVNEHKAKIWGIGLAFDSNEGYYIPVRTKTGEQFFSQETSLELIRVIKQLLSTKKIIGHNIIYDTIVWYCNYDQYIADNVHADTILMKHLIDEERPFGLKEVAVRYLGEWADKAQQDLLENIKLNGGSVTKSNLEMYKADTEVLGKYCTWDVLLTFKLYELFSIKLKEEKLEDFFYKEEVMPLYKNTTILMKKNGINVDVAYFQQLNTDIEIEIESLQQNILDWMEANLGEHFERYTKELLDSVAPVKKSGSFPKYLALELGEELPDSLAKKVLDKHQYLLTVAWLRGTEVEEDTLLRAQLRMFFAKKDQGHVFNLNSKDHLKYVFFNILAEEPLSMTDGGEPQVDEDFLVSVKKQYAFVPMLLDLNKLNKIKGTYIEGILERQMDGIIYTSMLQFGTTSGRYSSTNPNLQNLPRPKEDDAGLSELVLKYNNAIRKGFIAPEGYKFIDADYSALEPRCFSHMSGSKDLQNIFHSGVDMYSAIAIQMFNITDASANKKDANFLGKLYPEKRQQVKAFCLAVVYGAEAYRIGELLEIDRDEAQRLIDMYLDAFPDLRNYIKSCHYEVNIKGYVSTIYGRVRHLQRGRDLFKTHGYNLLDARWAKSKGLKEERREYKNLLNNSTNFKIQGLAAHIINKAMIRISNELRQQNIDGYICLTVHDQVICQVRDSQAEQVRSIVRDAMQTIVTLDVPLIAEPAIANNLKESH